MNRICDKHIGKRLDSFLLEYLHQENRKDFSRTFLKENWSDFIKVNNGYLKPSYKLKQGDVVEADLKNLDKILEKKKKSFFIKQQKGDLDVLFESKDFLVINKPKGLVVHPGVGNRENTLANIVRYYLEKKGEYNEGIKRAGVVHRLDKGVSGVIVFAKTLGFQRFLQKEFEEHRVNKVYLAKIGKIKLDSNLPWSSPQVKIDIQKEINTLEKNNFECDKNWYKVEGYIKRSNKNRVKMSFHKYKSGGGKYALSYFKPIGKKEILIVIKTGRMHQIRATLEYLGMKVEGDTLYGSAKGLDTPDKIELKSIYLGFKDENNEVFSISKF